MGGWGVRAYRDFRGHSGTAEHVRGLLKVLRQLVHVPALDSFPQQKNTTKYIFCCAGKSAETQRTQGWTDGSAKGGNRSAVQLLCARVCVYDILCLCLPS